MFSNDTRRRGARLREQLDRERRGAAGTGGAGDDDDDDEAEEERDAICLYWSAHEKNLFDAGFKKHSGQLRNISLGLPSKTTSEVIDFHYRFKIPSQYRKYLEKKRGRNAAVPINITPSVPPRPGSPGGGGSSAPAPSHTKRHNEASSFLAECRRRLPPDSYSRVVELLKEYATKKIEVRDLKVKVGEVVGKDLAKAFDGFLPKKHRG